MRARRKSKGLTVNAIAGTHVVLLGFDLDGEARAGCLGFAIQREDRTEDERYWLKGMKTFAATDPGLGPGGHVTSRLHPFQTFQWADYSAKPAHEYRYRIVPMYGSPAVLVEGHSVTVKVVTEPELGGGHAVYFNRGAVASQEYARRFLNQSPAQVGEPAYRWLSRGLLEAFQAFVDRASNSRYGLCGAIYEFQWAGALESMSAAVQRGVQVQIVHDAISGGSGPRDKNLEAIAAAGLGDVCHARTLGKIMHNKFLVLTEDGLPQAVWTGSTNLTENGIFGHSNCGHVVEDPLVAAAYLAYWNQLLADPSLAAERAWTGEHNPAPPEPWTSDATPVFSPRTGLRVLEWYAELAASARRALFMTFAFGMHDVFQAVYERDDEVLRFALMEKEGNGSGLAQGRSDVRRIRSRRNVVIAVGNSIALNSFDRWLKERSKLDAKVNVRYIHTKYMLVDPLGAEPVVVTGSANFSAASTNANDENMVVIRGNKRVADIYLGEFMRQFSHYAFREVVGWSRARGDEEWRPNFLEPDDDWQRDAFTAGNPRCLRRVYFAGG